MNEIVSGPLEELGARFVPEGFDASPLTEEERRQAQQLGAGEYRRLTEEEIIALEAYGNTAEDWNRILVSSPFDPALVRSCRFFGLVRIGRLQPLYLQFHDLKVPVGLYNSMIICCDIGDDAAVHNALYLAYYLLDRGVVILNVDEMQTTNYSKFGSGFLKEGETEDVRIWLELCNENGGRSILPFDGMLTSDAYLWAKYRGEPALMNRFFAMTRALDDGRRGRYGVVGESTVIKHCRIIKDVKIGSHAYLKGANKLKNLTINSSAEESTQIGEGVELVNGIIGYGCRIFYGVKAVRFILGTCSNLKYGARLVNSYLGDNSTISCCEVLNSLIFGSHEQHHNNSFLTATLIHGQSNIAAGVTAGSNHNSRAYDGELVARRGFWPGLCTTYKHNSRFASFTFVAKGNYDHELDIPLPFSLVSISEERNALQVRPGFWFLHNMYALMRNSAKWSSRDRRVHREQKFETDCLAPDTVDEMFGGLEVLETQTARAWMRGREEHGPETELRRTGRKLLEEKPVEVAKLEVRGDGMERSSREVLILKPVEGYAVYKEMIHYYCVRTLLRFAEESECDSPGNLWSRLRPVASTVGWTNLGGQLVRDEDLDELKHRIVDGGIPGWTELHGKYDELWERYPLDRAAHAYRSLLALHGKDTLSRGDWRRCLRTARASQEKILRLTVESRGKDYADPFRLLTYDDEEELRSVMGRLEENDFIRHAEEECREFCRSVDRHLES